MLNLSRLHLLQKLSVLGTISAVAEAMNLTRPAVSQQLALLEKETKAVLFERSTVGVKLTPSGKRLTAQVAKLFELVDEIETGLITSSEELSGDVRISAFGSLAAGLVPLVFKELLLKYPRLCLSFDEIESAGGLKAVAARTVDVALVNEWAGTDAFSNLLEFRQLCSNQFVAVLPSSHRLAARKYIRLEDLAQEFWAINHAASAYHTFLLSACYTAGFIPRQVCSCQNMLATLELIRTAGLVSVLPELGLRLAAMDPDLKIVPLQPAMNRNVLIALPKGTGNRPAVQAVILALKNAVDSSSGT